MKLEKLNLLDQSEIMFLQNIYLNSFPIEERRPIDQMLNLYEDNRDKFKILLYIK